MNKYWSGGWGGQNARRMVEMLIPISYGYSFANSIRNYNLPPVLFITLSKSPKLKSPITNSFSGSRSIRWSIRIIYDCPVPRDYFLMRRKKNMPK